MKNQSQSKEQEKLKEKLNDFYTEFTLSDLYMNLTPDARIQFSNDYITFKRAIESNGANCLPATGIE